MMVCEEETLTFSFCSLANINYFWRSGSRQSGCESRERER